MKTARISKKVRGMINDNIEGALDSEMIGDEEFGAYHNACFYRNMLKKSVSNEKEAIQAKALAIFDKAVDWVNLPDGGDREVEEIGICNAHEAADYWMDYGSLTEAVACCSDNAYETAIERGFSHDMARLATEAYDAKIKELTIFDEDNWTYSLKTGE